MKLFVTTFFLTAALTFASSFVQAQDNELATGSIQPMTHARFEKSPAQIYIMKRAREESEQRVELIRRYESVGFNYGQPEFTSGIFWTATPPMRRRLVYTPFFGY